MKATISKETQQACNQTLTIHDKVLYAVFPWSIDGQAGKLWIKADVDAAADVVNRTFSLAKLTIRELTFFKLADDKKRFLDTAPLESEQADLVMQQAAAAIHKFVGEEEQYLVDNHHDFEINLTNGYERMNFHNKGVYGSTTLTVKEDDMSKLQDDSKELKESLKVEFSASYTLEFVDEDKESVLMKDCTIDSFAAIHYYQDENNVWQEDPLKLNEADTAAMKKRIILAIEDNYVDAEFYINTNLGGNPIDE